MQPVLTVHDSLSVTVNGESAVLVVRRVQFNESAIALITLAGLAWFVVRFGSGLLVQVGLLGALVLLAALAISRALRIRIEVSSERVRILNYFRTFEFPWTEVQNVGIGALTQGPLLQPAIAFGLRDGRVVCAQATPRNPTQQRLLAKELASRAPNSVAWRPDLVTTEG